MKCDRCDNPATVHEVTVRQGAKVERHLCERCAAASGMQKKPISEISEMLQSMAEGAAPPQPMGPESPQPVVLRNGACPACKTTFADFKKHNQVGCAECYRALEAQLSPLIERWHEGGLKHVGKRPRRLCGEAGSQPGVVSTAAAPGISLEDRAERINRIRAELEAAVRTEQYERAARLRDEMRKLAGPGPG